MQLGVILKPLSLCVDKNQRLENLKIVVDCANGAAYKAAPFRLFELGADVVPINVDPNGFNINHECGAVYPKEKHV